MREIKREGGVWIEIEGEGGERERGRVEMEGEREEGGVEIEGGRETG